MSAYRINTENLCVGYDSRAVVTDIDLKLESGQIMTLIGPNGAGKSTILKTLTRNLRPLAGTVYLDSRDLLDINGEELAKKLSIVMTERLSGELMNCFDAAATGRYPYTGRFGTLSARDREIVRAALSRVDAEDLSALPFDRVSDGQRQRVMLARARGVSFTKGARMQKTFCLPGIDICPALGYNVSVASQSSELHMR